MPACGDARRGRTHGEPFGLAWKGLPLPPEQLLVNHGVIDSVNTSNTVRDADAWARKPRITNPALPVIAPTITCSVKLVPSQGHSAVEELLEFLVVREMSRAYRHFWIPDEMLIHGSVPLAYPRVQRKYLVHRLGTGPKAPQGGFARFVTGAGRTRAGEGDQAAAVLRYDARSVRTQV
jgi:hypothetical protein